MSETRKLVAILVADVVGADVDHFRLVPIVARPASMKEFYVLDPGVFDHYPRKS
jgi:hypothetical protein